MSQFAEDLKQRLLGKREVLESGCWNWTGHLSMHGYGITYAAGAHHRVHRLAYTLWNGAIPNGLHIDHLCRNRPCFNPEHLECVTPKVNVLRGIAPSAMNAKVTHCPMGHAYDSINTYIKPSGGRGCKNCRRAANKKYYKKVMREKSNVALNRVYARSEE